METSQDTPGCYHHTASQYDQNLISTQVFFSQCLSHLGPTSSRVHHQEDTEPLTQQLRPLFWKGQFGPVAAAIKLCETDPLAESITVEELVPLFVACATAPATIETIQASASQNILASPLFRQALIVTSLKSGNDPLARALITHAPATPPPPETCVFKMHLSSLVEEEEIPAGAWAALVTAGWAAPSAKLVLWGASSSSGPDGVALLEALAAAGYDMHANATYREALPSLALVTSEPEVIAHLFALYGVVPTSDMLVQAVEARDAGRVEVLRWLLDTYALDVNYVRTGGRGPFDADPARAGDPRERAEMEHAVRQAGRLEKPRTALHAAVLRGNAEACEFLRGRGAVDGAASELRRDLYDK